MVKVAWYDLLEYLLFSHYWREARTRFALCRFTSTLIFTSQCSSAWNMCVFGVCGHVGRSYINTAIWPSNGSSWPLDRPFLLTEAFISKSTSCIARECHKKLTDHDNLSYKPELKSLESGQTDGQTDTHTDRQTTLTLSCMCRGLKMNTSKCKTLSVQSRKQCWKCYSLQAHWTAKLVHAC